MGTAAYKTVELDDYFDQAAIQHRETQGHESLQFTKLFKEITYLEGGVDSGFHHVEGGTQIKKLFRVRKTKHTVRVAEVPCTRKSLNQGDCFLLDLGDTLYPWFGEDASPFERAKCGTRAHNVAISRHGKCAGEGGAGRGLLVCVRRRRAHRAGFGGAPPQKKKTSGKACSTSSRFNWLAHVHGGEARRHQGHGPRLERRLHPGRGPRDFRVGRVQGVGRGAAQRHADGPGVPPREQQAHPHGGPLRQRGHAVHERGVWKAIMK